MIKKLGVVKTLLVSFAMGAGANILLLFTKDIFFCYALFGSITTFATIPMMCLVGVMTAMSIDYNEYKYGVRMVATSNSASSFGGKVGSGLGTSIIGWFLAAVGYDAAQTVAPAATKMAIYGFAIVTPFSRYFFTMAYPIPRVPPVTTAIFPFSIIFLLLAFFRHSVLFFLQFLLSLQEVFFPDQTCLQE